MVLSPRNTPHKAENSEVRSLLEELQRDALPTHWWPCQTHRRLFFPTQGERDNHVGRDNHGGQAGEQPNGFNNQMGGMETRLMGLTVNVDVFCWWLMMGLDRDVLLNGKLFSYLWYYIVVGCPTHKSSSWLLRIWKPIRSCNDDLM